MATSTQLKTTGKTSLGAIDLFSGCGGLSCGLKMAGFEVRAAVEIERKAQATYRLNHPEVRLFAEDIRNVDPETVLSEIGLRKGELDLLAGCPPCQGFSRLRTMNKRTAVRDDRNNLVSDFIRFIKAIEPKTVMLENVPSLGRNQRFVMLRKTLTSLGYQLVFRVLDAADYKVPQRRKRLILMASKVHVPTIAVASTRRVTVREAIGRVETPAIKKDSLHRVPENRSDAVRELIAAIPKDGGSRSDLGKDRQLDCHKRSDGFYDVYGRMAWDDVSPTITSGCHNPSKGRFLHPQLNRTITLREAALLQGFPMSYQFDVSHGKEAIALMIGNALPPPFIMAHAETLRDGLLAARNDFSTE